MRMIKVLFGVIIVLCIVYILVGYLPSAAPAIKAGSLDTSFNSPNGFILFNNAANNKDRGVELVIQDDGKIIALGYSNNSINEDVLLARFNTDGSLDASFGKGGFILYDGGGNDRGLGLALQNDGKIVASGYTYAGSQRDVLVLRYNANGTPDRTFGTGGVVTYSSPGSGTDIGFGVAIQTDGGIIVVGETSNRTNQDALVLRYTTTGSLDNKFGTRGVVMYGGAGMDRGFATTIQQDKKIIVAGSSVVKNKDDVLVFRLNPDGTMDGTFGSGGTVMYSGSGDNSDYGNCVSLQSDNKIVVSGAVSEGSAFDVFLLRYNQNGTPDITFGNNGVAVYGDAGEKNDYGYAHVIQRDGRIVITGFTRNGANDDVLLVRFDPTGQPDKTFGNGGMVTWNGQGNNMDYGQGIALQSDGKIAIIGFSHNGVNEDMLLMRFMQ
jgi:uncharacterized delta-60 repeat protein